MEKWLKGRDLGKVPEPMHTTHVCFNFLHSEEVPVKEYKEWRPEVLKLVTKRGGGPEAEAEADAPRLTQQSRSRRALHGSHTRSAGAPRLFFCQRRIYAASSLSLADSRARLLWPTHSWHALLWRLINRCCTVITQVCRVNWRLASVTALACF